MKEIKKAGSSGKMVIGECGGLMYLGKHLTNTEGKKIPMAGLFDYSTSIKARKLTLGYRKLKPAKTAGENSKLTLLGHEFHYSTFIINNELPEWKNSLKRKGPLLRDGFTNKNCHSFYTHIYWASNKNWLNYLME